MNQSTSDRPLLLILLSHDYLARDLFDSGVLSHLRGQYDLLFVTTEGLGMDLTTFGQVAAVHRMTWLRTRLWEAAFGLRHLSGLDPIIKTQVNRHAIFQRGTPGPIKRIVSALHRFGLSGIVSSVIAKLLAMTASNFNAMPRMPTVALLPSGIKDLAWDDTVTFCRRHDIPSLTVTINWDNIAHKVFLQQPDRLGVWGEQGFLFARLFQKVPVKDIVTLGSPRFESYRNFSMSKTEARRKLDLPETARILLFAGAGVVFDEVSLIEEFDQAMNEGDLPADLYMVYKPHPKRHKRAAEPPLRPERYRHVRVWGGNGLTPLSDYPVLLSAVDALVTPMSTMVLEGALMGLPALGLAYDDPAHGDYSWDNARLNNHLHPIINSRWHVLCEARGEFLLNLRRLLDLIGDPGASDSARSTARFILHDDGRSYAVRLVEALQGLVTERQV